MTEENAWKSYVDFMINGPPDRPEDVFERWDLPPTRKRRKRRRKPTLASLSKKARELGVDVAVALDGSMILKCSAPAATEPAAGNGASENPWDEVLPHAAH
jgi:hypothetical protein